MKHQEYIYQVLARFNAAVKVVEEAIGISSTDEEAFLYLAYDRLHKYWVLKNKE